MVLPFMTLYCTQEKHFTMPMAGLVVSLYGLGAMLGAFIGGKLSDTFGFYRIQVLSLFLGGLSFILLGQMQSYTAICTCTFFLSMVNEAFRPANASAIASYSEVENRTRSFALVRLAINMGWGIGSAFGGWLAAVGYKWLFWVDGFTNIGAAILLLLLLPYKQHKVSVPARQAGIEKETMPAALSPWKDGPYMAFIGCQLLFGICFFQLFTTVPLYFKVGLHLSEFWIGTVMALNGVLIAVVEMVLVFKLEGKRPYLTFIIYGTLLTAVSYAALNLGIDNGLTVAIISTILVTFGEMLGMPFMNSYYINRSTAQNRGQYAAIYTMAWSAAQVIGSSTGTQAAYSLGFANWWWLVTGACIVTAFGYYLLQQREKAKIT